MDHQEQEETSTQTRKTLLVYFPINKRTVFLAISFLIISISSVFVFNLPINSLDYNIFRFKLFFSQLLFSRNNPSKPCDYSNGKWVWDQTYKNQSETYHTYTENCPFIDPGFQCTHNGRQDQAFRHWRWQPNTCNLPRFNARELLDRSRNGRIVFAGDSIGRNQWESMLCMLAKGVSNISSIYEENGNSINKHKGFLSMRFEEYNVSVEYYRVPYLVITGRPPLDSPKQVYGTIRVDELHWYSKQWVGADVLIFNDGHWWNQDKTIKMGYYFQEGGKVNMSITVNEAFQKSLQTWKSWALNKLDQNKTHVFFRSYSPVHYRSGTWNQGGNCDNEKEPETDYTKLENEPENNIFISDVIKQMDSIYSKAMFLNITYLTEFRKDGHPSKYREPGTPALAPQDCSHWCLPGIPDTWNELVYANLLSKGFRRL